MVIKMETDGIELITGEDGKLHLVKDALRVKKVVGEGYIFNIDEHIISSKEDSEKMKELLSKMVKDWDKIKELYQNNQNEDIMIEHNQIEVVKRVENINIDDGNLKDIINSLKQDATNVFDLKEVRFVGLNLTFQGKCNDGTTIQFTSKLKTKDYDDSFDDE